MPRHAIIPIGPTVRQSISVKTGFSVLIRGVDDETRALMLISNVHINIGSQHRVAPLAVQARGVALAIGNRSDGFCSQTPLVVAWTFRSGFRWLRHTGRLRHPVPPACTSRESDLLAFLRHRQNRELEWNVSCFGNT